MTTTTRRNLHQEITNNLIAAIESNPGDLSLPWRRTGGALHIPKNALSNKAYRGINIVSLWVTAEARGFSTPVWATYKQWTEKGCQVRRGEKAALVIFYKEYEAEPDADNPDDNGQRRVARASYVFNADQVDGYEYPASVPMLGPVERVAAADRFVFGTGATVRHGGQSAYFDPASDRIQMPDEGRFIGTQTMTRSEGYYATLVHELIHWSGAKSRLNRDMGKRFADAAYAAEELVAEIGAAFLCAELGIAADTRPDHAQYLAQWLKLLKDDDRAIFSAAARASEAATYLRGLISAQEQAA